MRTAWTVTGILLVAGCFISGGGCRQEGAASGTGSSGATNLVPSPTGSASGGAAATGRRAADVDRQDDPEAPRALPKTYELRGWFKAEPVRVFPPERLAEALADADKAVALSTFRLRRGARCAYQRDRTIARVLLIEAASPEDAFGVFSMMTPRPGVLHPTDGTVRVVERERDAIVLTGWQGDMFAQLRCTGTTEGGQSAADCEALLVRILFNVPSADPPWLMRAVVGEKGETAKLWLVRRSVALAAVQHPVLRQISPEVMDVRLGLTGEVFLAVASVQAGRSEAPNFVWLVRYERPADAQAAGERYRKAVQSPDGRLDANTIVDQPKGAFLIGSWTADQEAVQKILPRLRSILPE